LQYTKYATLHNVNKFYEIVTKEANVDLKFHTFHYFNSHLISYFSFKMLQFKPKFMSVSNNS